jgi:Uma2 family endonuclease
MVAHARAPRITFEEYLRLDRQSETKSEFASGEILAMAGASYAHNLIVGATVYLLAAALEVTPCRTVSSDQRLRVPECDRAYYPDVMVVCDEPQFVDGEKDTLLNPTVIVEVLSESTEKKDRTEKLDCYSTISSLKAYLLVAQDRPRVERYTPDEDGTWRLLVANSLEGSLEIPALNCALDLRRVYSNIAFPT